MLAIVTPEYLASESCRREWATFQKREPTVGKHKPLILPLLLRRPNAVPDWLARRQWIDLTDLPLSASSFTRSVLDPSILDPLTRIAGTLSELVRSAPRFDPHWSVSRNTMRNPGSKSITSCRSRPRRTWRWTPNAVTALLKTDGRAEAIEAGQRLVRRLRTERDLPSLGEGR